MESVASFIRSNHETAFSFEILPPIRGNSIDKTFANIGRLMEYSPSYINITTHRTQVEYQPTGGGSYRIVSALRRPGTVAVAAAISQRYGVRTVPHLICGDYSRREIEDQLIDLSYLGITDLLVLRGDRNKESQVFTSAEDGHMHAASLARQVTDYNAGILTDGERTEAPSKPFTFGVAGYPEKHEEAMNMHTDIKNLKEKVEAGASYIITQMFFDNKVFFKFAERCREAGITVPIVPGIKPLTSLRQMAILPRVFHIDLPEELSEELLRCKSDEDVKRLGVEWGTKQARELKAANVPSIHFYAMHATESVAQIAKNVY